MKTMIAATLATVLGATALGLGSVSAYAAEGNSEPFLNNNTTAVTRSVSRLRPGFDVGSAAYPDVMGRPGSNLPSLAGDVLPSNGSEGAVQTANSLPAHFEDGTVTFVQATSVRNWMLAHERGNATSIYAGGKAYRTGG